VSTPSEDPEEGVTADGGRSEQDAPVRRSTSSYPPPPPGGSVQVRGMVRVSERPPPATAGDLELELDSEDEAAPEVEVAPEAEVPPEAEVAPEAEAASEALPEEDPDDEDLEIEVEEEPEEPAEAEGAAPGEGDRAEAEADEPGGEAAEAAEAHAEAASGPDLQPEAEPAPEVGTAGAQGPTGEPAEGSAEPEADPVADAQEAQPAADDGSSVSEEPAVDEPLVADAEAPAADDASELPADELEIEEVEEEDPDALELQEMEAEEEKPAPPAPEPPKPPVRKRKRPWFEGFFNDDYLRTVPPPTEKEVKRQCDFIERVLGLERGGTILDVGCGLGMHAVELSERGYLVVGLDLSLAMLSRAGDEAQDRGLKINFLHGDMREMAFEGAFDAVLCWGTTFGYFDDEANRKVIERLYKALKPGGVLLLDVVNRDFVISKQPNLIWFEGDGCVCMEETTFNHITSRLEVKRTVILDDGRQRETRYGLRLYSLHELGQILHLQGFRVAEVSGAEATKGVYLGADSPRLIILAERRMRPSGPPTGEAPRPLTGELSIPPPPPTPGDGSSNGQGS
jgi:SAM-dependent methyltransferase